MWLQSSTARTDYYESNTLAASWIYGPTAAQSLAMAVRTGTGANNGVTLTVSAQPGQAQTGGAANNNGGILDIQSGPAGTGGGGAAGVDGNLVLRTGTTSRVALPGAGAHTYSAGADSTVRREYGTAATRYIDYVSKVFTSDSAAGYETALSYTLPDNCVAEVISVSP